ncbi:MAG: UDP-N-acetylmuramoyl-L-alanyl-D-glutamate--2,6-diaminopimelate ligase [Desulfurivibrio sp.]|nr:UDP-N-acetylmuramoyl-L-alanyl-D-glutamate--2,6-diaminopimelate ligase [Desulfurivibrio sp.]
MDDASDEPLLWLQAADTREALGTLCAAFWDHPARSLVMIGITGTNGKTTCAYLLEALLAFQGAVPGVIGTISYRYRGREVAAAHTTPEPETLQRLLAEMRQAGVSHVIMEVSSHALAQRRVAGIQFDVALFTNLSRDHLDYHADMESYFAAKMRLFRDHLKPGGAAVLGAGELAATTTEGGNGGGSRSGSHNWSRRLLTELQAKRQAAVGKDWRLWRCGFEVSKRLPVEGGELRLLAYQAGLDGIRARLASQEGEWELSSPLVGDFNLLNLLGVAGVGLALGQQPATVAAGLAAAPPPPGRLERWQDRRGVVVFVDYAHTPAALEQVLGTLRPHARRLLVIFGCGGDRDRGKRHPMGEIAGRLADIVVLTSDNPRHEEPHAILAAIEEGVRSAGLQRCRLETLLAGAGRRGYDLLVSRRRAIAETLYFAAGADVILLCGKGHETYQQIGNQCRYFDDRQEVARELAVVH